MGRRAVLALASGVLAALLMASCQPPVSPDELLRAGDRIAPTITISSHQTGDPFSEPLTTVTGTMTDDANQDGAAGRIGSASWSVQGSTAAGTLNLAADGAFSVEVNTEARATELGLVVGATASVSACAAPRTERGGRGGGSMPAKGLGTRAASRQEAPRACRT